MAHPLVIVGLLVAVGCSGPSDGATDGGSATPDSSAEPSRFDIAPPVPPAPPELECSDGWMEVVSETGVQTCAPWPEGTAACPAGEVRFPGDPACAPIGAPCPAAGAFAPDLPTDSPVVYLRAGAPPGDGSLAAPYGTFREALAVARDAVVALAVGRYDASTILTSGATLYGACTADTVLVPADPSIATLEIRGTGALRQLSIAAGGDFGLRLSGMRASASIDDVDVQGGLQVAVGAADGATANLRRVRIGGADEGPGVVVQDGARASIARGYLVRNRSVGTLAARPPSELVLTDVAIVDTAERLVGSHGRGIHVIQGGRTTAERVVIERSSESAVYSDDASVELSAFVIDDTRPRSVDGETGQGVTATGASTVVLRTGSLERNVMAAIVPLNTSSVTVEDTVISDTAGSASDGRFGEAIAVTPGTHVDARRVVFERNHEAGAFVDTASMVLEDAVVRDTQSQRATRRFGRGLQVFGSQIELRRAVFERSRQTGVQFTGGSRATIEDLVVRDTDGREVDGRAGGALDLYGGSVAELRRARFERNRFAGVATYDEGTRLTAFDVVVVDNEAERALGALGRGLTIELESEATLERVLLTGCREASLVAFGGGRVVASEIEIRRTRTRACADTWCGDFPAGIGVTSLADSYVSATGFTIDGSPLCGVQVALGGAIDLRDGDITNNAVGVCVQDPAYDLGRLDDGVRYLDNGVNLDATALPTPDQSSTGPAEVPSSPGS